MTFHKLLIANRGEIACRIIKTAHEMGIACVAVYTEADTYSPFVRMADQAIKLSDSYLNGNEIINAAKQTGAEACLLYTSPSPRDLSTSRMPSSA